MSLATDIRGGLSGAFLLARGRPEGILRMSHDAAGAARSFWAVAICLPGFVLLRLLTWQTAGTPPDALHALAASALLYVIGWAGYALLSRPVVAAYGRTVRWPRFIAAWNWCNVVQYILLLAASMPGAFGAPGWVDQALGLIALFWALWLQWFATRLALDVRGWQATLLVLLDVVVGLVLGG